jgi:predicted PolB exonuclease-like 3'-5' exonuclease
MTPVLVFDIETIPDVAGFRRLWDLDPQVSDEDVAEIAFQRRRAASASGSDFLPPHMQRVASIACALREADSIRVWSLGSPADSEEALIRRFFDGIEKYTPQLVSWNGGGFDLPVLHYRGLVHGISAPRYWDMGEDDREFKWNNYISRYHTRHLDLMDLLAMYELAKLIGFPGKLGMDGSKVWQAYNEGHLSEIRAYCETDVANTYLVFLRYQLMRGAIDSSAYARETALLRETLSASPEKHWQEFLAAWPV